MYQARVEIRNDRHLLARHRIEGEARRNLGNADGTVINHDVLDSEKYEEDDDSDDVVATDNKIAESLDYFASSPTARVSLQQD